ncbi:MAG: hypothetical protein PUP92_22775 [Rhizonema sp. PD38]|nr:hypothetical protein [Rhizonema sp. PD38]
MKRRKGQFNSVLSILNIRLSAFEKLLYSLISILLLTTLIVWIFKTYFSIAISISIGFLGIGSGIYLLNRRYMLQKQNNERDLKSRNTVFGNYVKTMGGNYNESINGNYIQGDYINIQGDQIDISQDLTQILAQLQDILRNIENQGYSAEEAQTQIVNQLAKEIRRKPQLKAKLNFDENTGEDVYEQLINLLNTSSYFGNHKPLRVHNFLEDDNDYEERVSYKGYTIYLETDKDGQWHYRIDGLLVDDTGCRYFKSSAIDEAKGKIDEERFGSW